MPGVLDAYNAEHGLDQQVDAYDAEPSLREEIFVIIWGLIVGQLLRRFDLLYLKLVLYLL